jgi:hypothetical protein
MSTEKRVLRVVAGLVSGAMIVILFARIKTWSSRKQLLKNVDVFAEPIKERFNEFIDIVAVTFDVIKETLLGSIEQKRSKSVETHRKIKTAPGRYVRTKD